MILLEPTSDRSSPISLIKTVAHEGAPVIVRQEFNIALGENNFLCFSLPNQSEIMDSQNPFKIKANWGQEQVPTNYQSEVEVDRNQLQTFVDKRNQLQRRIQTIEEDSFFNDRDFTPFRENLVLFYKYQTARDLYDSVINQPQRKPSPDELNVLTDLRKTLEDKYSQLGREVGARSRGDEIMLHLLSSEDPDTIHLSLLIIPPQFRSEDVMQKLVEISDNKSLDISIRRLAYGNLPSGRRRQTPNPQE